MPDSVPRLRRLAAALWIVSAATLAVSLALPTVTFRKVMAPAETYSIWGGVRQLWEDGTHVLAVVVFLFSIVFPIAKLVALAAVFLGCRSAAWRRTTLRRLELLGKWSLLDVLMIAMFVGSIRLGVLANASSRAGILVFGTSIMLSMLCARVLGGAEGAGERPRLDARLGGWPRVLLSAATLALVVAAFWLPVFEIQKALLFRSTLELSRTTWKMAGSGELPLALIVGLLVVATTLARALLSLWLRVRGRGSARAMRWVLWLEEWALIDVFALALVIVRTKLAQLTDTSLGPGFALVLAAALLMELDGWLLRRAMLGAGSGGAGEVQSRPSPAP